MNADDFRKAANPFPRTAVAITPDEPARNYLTHSQARALNLVQTFGDRFAASTAVGMAAGVRGAIGGGKTHTVFRMQNEMLRIHPTAKCIYAKTLNARTLLEFYSETFASSLRLDDFRNLASQHFLKLLKARQQQEGTEGAAVLAEAVKQADASLAEGNQQYLLDLIQADLIPSIELRADLRRDLVPAEKLLLGDLALAYSKILNKRYGETAILWLQGKPLSDQQMRDLGVRNRIDTVPNAQLALRFLLDAYRRADVPIMLSIDELERSVLNDAGTPDVTGRNLLKDIAEAIVASGHFYVLCGLRMAWDSLSPDFFGRLARADIVDMELTAAEAEEIIHAYEGGDSAFSGAALAAAAEACESSVRRLLEIAHHSWEIWSSGDAAKIQAEDVRQATRRAIGDARRRQDAIAAIARYAKANGIPASRDARVGYDFTLGAPQSPLLAFVKVTASVFKEDEADDVRKILESRLGAVRDFPAAATCTVIAGYSSPPIVEELRRAGDYVIRFDEADFDNAFGGFVTATRERIATAAAAPPRAAQDNDRYATLLEKFDTVVAQNREQLQELRRSFEALQQQKLRNVEEGFSKSSADKLQDVLEELTSLLGQENSLLHSDQRFMLPENYSRQHSLVQYAVFLDRVVAESDISGLLVRYGETLQQPDFGGDPSALLVLHDMRMRLLREMRRASRTGATRFQALRAAINLRGVAATIGFIGMVAYLVLAVLSFYSERDAVNRYARALDQLREYTLQYGPSVQGEFRPLLFNFNQARRDFRATHFNSAAYRGGSSRVLDETVGTASSAIACNISSAKACDPNLADALGSLRQSVGRELELLPSPSVNAFVPSYFADTGLVLLPAILLIVPWLGVRMGVMMSRPQPK